MKKTLNSKKAFIVGFHLAIVLVTLLVGFLLSDKVFADKISEKDFNYLEETINSVYAQGENKIIYEIPEDVRISIDNHKTISAHIIGLNRGSVTGTLHENQIVFEHHNELGTFIFLFILLSVLLLLLEYIIADVFYEKWKKKKKAKMNAT